ncbi:DCC1-like thiol-disulfide oxidoreductase family protein [Leptospira ellinghausenii]|uniref:DCC1-like thiol-disulfide oxidoreductase family protein n=1 Tax=Leptospira ellinghausenii TaxID=1917822 RepID=UPI001FE3737E|nr:DCC1-like thiol-disulfide oxidoreductase family protein [Leptospira ellinghausenii]
MKLIFDGECSFCNQLAHSLQNRSIQPIEIVSYHTLSEEELNKIHPQLTRDKCKGEVQIIQDGNRFPGFFGVRVLLWNVRLFRYFVWILYLPLFPFLGMFVMMILKKFKKSFV